MTLALVAGPARGIRAPWAGPRVRRTMHPNSTMLFERYARPHFHRGMRVLEIGPDGSPTSYQRIVADESIRWETIDVFQSPQLTYVARADYDFPIESDTYDVIVSGQVIEHVKKIWLWMRELSRICKPGGLVVTINPVNWPFHENPVDCWRIYPDGMRSLHDDAGLDTLLALFEALDPTPMADPSALELFKQGARRLLGRHAWLPRNAQSAIDAISIGKKRPAT
jgi:SAM-dependent methyltransferase